MGGLLVSLRTLIPVWSLQEELYLQRVGELDEITTQRDDFKRGYEELRKQRLHEFMGGFNIITNKLKENYQMLTQGGDAELELVDSLDPFSEGINFRQGLPMKLSQYFRGNIWTV